MRKTGWCVSLLLLMFVTLRAVSAADHYVGHWALTLPDGRAGWLGVSEKEGELTASLLWGGGSVTPVASVQVRDAQLVLTRVQKPRKGPSRGQKITETITATRQGDSLQLVTEKVRSNGKRSGRAEFTGKRTPPLPPRPDLAQLKYGDAVGLFNGKDLAGWESLQPQAVMGWHVKDGILMNRTHHEDGKRVPHANLRTVESFEDFRLTMDVRTLAYSNSGVYLRGIYEIQIFESYGKPLDSHHMGALYSRITPAVSAEKPIGQWQTLDITLVDRHVTVILNGTRVIDNQPVLGCTGGALWSDPLRPGPIYLQGNHSDVDFRNLILRPVID